MPLEDAQYHEPSPSEFPPIIDGDSINGKIIQLPPQIIAGVVSLTEKLELAGGSKSFKTWSLIDMGLSVSSEIPWWGHQTFKHHVVYLNLELSGPFFEFRLQEVAKARQVDIPAEFHIIHLRGHKLSKPDRWKAFLKYLEGLLHRFPNPLLISDPIYKMLGGKNENSAGDINEMMDQLEDLVQLTQGANAFGHHFTKGNQSDKDAIDRASGSGVFQRDPDTLLTMTKHEHDECYSTNYIVRNHLPISDRVMEWHYPLFVPRTDLDPKDLKPRGAPSKYTVNQLVDVLGTRSMLTKAFQMRASNEIGMTRSTFYLLLKKADISKLLVKNPITEEWSKNI